MIQKQILGLIIGVAAIGLVLALVYRQFTSDSMAEPMMEKQSTNSQNTAPAPESVDDISASIVSESRVDATAFDEEESGMIDEVNADSESVNNLGTSYDSNSF